MASLVVLLLPSNWRQSRWQLLGWHDNMTSPLGSICFWSHPLPLITPLFIYSLYLCLDFPRYYKTAQQCHVALWLFATKKNFLALSDSSLFPQFLQFSSSRDIECSRVSSATFPECCFPIMVTCLFDSTENIWRNQNANRRGALQRQNICNCKHWTGLRNCKRNCGRQDGFKRDQFKSKAN